LKDLNDIPYWFFSAIIQFNGSVIGLVLAALAISFIMHSEKTVFLFKKQEFERLRYSIYLFILNAFLGFLGLSVIYKANYLIELMSITLIIESLALLFLGLIFRRSLDIFQYELHWELNKRDAEKIIKNLSIEHQISNDNRNLLFLANKDQLIFDVEGTIYPRIYRRKEPGLFSYSSDVLPIQAIRIPLIGKLNNRTQLVHIPKEILDLMKIEDNLEFNMLLKFRKTMYDFFYITVLIAFKKIDDECLKLIREPSFTIVDKESYTSISENLMDNPFTIKTNLLFT
jgi:hypothetical protein